MKKSFVLHCDSLDVLDYLSDAQAGLLLRKMKSYNSGVDFDSKDKIVEVSFVGFKNQFDRDLATYKSVCDRNARNGAKGGRPPNNPKNPSGYSGNPKEPKEPDSDSDSEKDSESKSKSKSKIKPLSNTSVPEGLRKFIDSQALNMLSIAVQIKNKGESYYQASVSDYEKLFKDVSKVGDSSVLVPMILDFVSSDDFWQDKIGSIAKLRAKNSSGTQYRLVMLERMKQLQIKNKQAIATF